MDKSRIAITCAPRVTPVLSKEITDLGFDIDTTTHMGIELTGDLEDAMKLNLYLRTANRVLLEIKSFKAKDGDELYKHIYAVNWEDYFSNDGYICVNGFVKNETILDTRFANLKVKDAIVDRFMDKTGKRPNSGPDFTKSVVYLHWKEEDASIYLDTSGETIAKHGYRKVPHKAPMMESLAAATILASRWDKNSPFINPMCGSGTLAIEAAMIATNRPPGLYRQNFAFMHTKFYNPFIWKELKNEAFNNVKDKIDIPIIATDMDNRAISAAQHNAATAFVEKFITFKTCDFRDTPVPEGEAGVVIFNPEYGRRLGEEAELEPVYAAMGDFFKQNCKGYTGYIFTGNMHLAKKVGLKTKRRIEFYNAKIDCRLLEYELYAGTKKNA